MDNIDKLFFTAVNSNDESLFDKNILLKYINILNILNKKKYSVEHITPHISKKIEEHKYIIESDL